MEETFGEVLDRRLVSERKLAKALDVSVTAVYKWRNTNQVPFDKAGNLSELLGEDVTMYVATRRVGRPADSRVVWVCARTQKHFQQGPPPGCEEHEESCSWIVLD